MNVRQIMIIYVYDRSQIERNKSCTIDTLLQQQAYPNRLFVYVLDRIRLFAHSLMIFTQS